MRTMRRDRPPRKEGPWEQARCLGLDFLTVAQARYSDLPQRKSGIKLEQADHIFQEERNAFWDADSEAVRGRVALHEEIIDQTQLQGRISPSQRKRA